MVNNYIFKVISIFIVLKDFCLTGIWEKYQVTEDIEGDIEINVLSDSDDMHGLYIYKLNRKYSNVVRRKGDIMLVDSKWERAAFFPFFEIENCYNFLAQIFYSKAVKRQIIQLHSSLIDYQGNGLMFLGPSGIGKTTQAELWNQYRDALIINGDVVFVQETPDAFLGWGTPWHGSSPYCENTSVPVKALIVLKQAPENSIRELTGFEKVTAVSNNVFYPRWLEGGMELCLETLNHLLSALPVYELSCRPDEEAVRLTEEAVFGGSV